MEICLLLEGEETEISVLLERDETAICLHQGENSRICRPPEGKGETLVLVEEDSSFRLLLGEAETPVTGGIFPLPAAPFLHRMGGIPLRPIQTWRNVQIGMRHRRGVTRQIMGRGTKHKGDSP